MAGLAANDIAKAGAQLDSALKINSGYFPSRALQAKIVLRNSEPDRAITLIEPLTKEPGAMTPAAWLTLAEAMCVRKGSTDKDKQDAAGILQRYKDKVQPPAEVGRVAVLCDPKLPEKLGVPVPTGDANAQKSGSSRRRHR